MKHRYKIFIIKKNYLDNELVYIFNIDQILVDISFVISCFYIHI